MARVVNLQPIIGGIRETLKSAPVEEMCGEAARRAAARCNAMYSLQTRPRIEPYGSKTVQRGYTAGGLVYCATKLGAIDNLKYNTLKKGCGV